ncbi:MAG TPA: PQQ-binding-like beta-propeller repeat protein [Ktedonobacterales bacterium]|nr:PQQ-binding-like beta-propeller repeat protein [Ktedonobacterales bacterium]
MPDAGKVYISHAPEDSARCAALLAALDAWEMPYWFDRTNPGAPPQELSQQAWQAITTCDYFLRVCTPATQRSQSMGQEANAFRGMQASDQRHGNADRRVLINLILDPGYQREPFDNATLFIDTTSKLRPVWMGELGRALGQRTIAGRLSRRTMLALGATGAVALASGSAASVLALTRNTAPSKKQPISALSGQARWHTAAGKYGGGVAIAQNVIYATSDAGVMALDGAKGAILWKSTEASNSSTNCAPLVLGNVIYLLDAENGIFALSTNKGTKIWHSVFAFDPNTRPVVAHNMVYAASEEGNLHAFDLKAGRENWSMPIGNWRDLSSDPVSAPAYSDGLLYVGSTDHTLYALDAGAGSIKWKYLTRGKVASSPVVGAGLVYFGSTDGNVYALDAHSGKERWRFPTGGAVFASPLLVGPALYIGSHDKHLYALKAATGAPYWSALAGEKDDLGFVTGDAVDGPAVADDQRVYVTTTKYLWAFNISDGSRAWRYAMSENSYGASAPVLGNGFVCFGSSDGNVYAVNT